MRSFDNLESTAEAIVFAHEPDSQVPASSRETAELERIAALATVAMASHTTVPPSLRSRLTEAGMAWCRDCGPEPSSPPDEPRALPERLAPDRRHGLGTFLLGAAAVALLWLSLGLRPAAEEPSIAEQRAELLRETGALQLDWSAGPSPRSGTVTGDVVWSHGRQEGYMTFAGLPPLDREHRFQLWIVDGDRQGAPVDGGLFTIASATEQTIVPMAASLPIGNAAGFVVTIEAWNGAVVSEQEHVVATAIR